MPLQCSCPSKGSFLFNFFHVLFLIVVVASSASFARASTSSFVLKHSVVVKTASKSAAASAAGRFASSGAAASASATFTARARAAARASASVGARATATTTTGRALNRLRRLKLPGKGRLPQQVKAAFRPSATTISTTTTTTGRQTVRSVFQRAPGWITSRTTASNPATDTGFKQFSQRATRLQNKLQKSFSLRAIFSDVITNHPGSGQKEKPVSTTTTSMMMEESNTLEHKEDAVSDLLGLQDAVQKIVTGTIRESWGGFVGGYGLAMTTDVTKKVARRMLYGVRPAAATATATATAAATATGGHILPHPSLLRHSQRSLQMHSRYVQFGMEWAQMSAVFGACRLLVQSIRKEEHRDDEWNTITGSALAGAVFACSYKHGKLHLPPVAMTRGAILYGGTMLLLHPHLWWKQGIQAAAVNLQQSLSMPTPTPIMEASMATSSSTSTTTSTNLPWWDGME